MRHDVEVKLEKGWTNSRPGAFRIGYQGPEPNVVAAVVNRLASLNIEENLRVREVQAEGTSQFLEAQLGEAKKTLDGLETAVSQYKLAHNGELPQQESAISSTLGRLQTDLQGTQDAINRAQQNRIIYEAELGAIATRLSALGETRDGPAPDRAAPPQESSARTPSAPIKASAVLADRLTALRMRYSDDHPEVRRMKMALAQALKEEERIAAAPASAPSRTEARVVAQERSAPSLDAVRETEQLRQRVSTLTAQRDIADAEIQRATVRRQSILQQAEAYQSQLRK